MTNPDWQCTHCGTDVEMVETRYIESRYTGNESIEEIDHAVNGLEKVN